MLDLPWLVAPRDLAAGELITLGREVDDTTRPPTTRDVTLTLADAVPAGTILGLGDDGRLHRLTAQNATGEPKPGGRTTRVDAATTRRAATVSRPAR